MATLVGGLADDIWCPATDGGWLVCSRLLTPEITLGTSSFVFIRRTVVAPAAVPTPTALTADVGVFNTIGGVLTFRTILGARPAVSNFMPGRTASAGDELSVQVLVGEKGNFKSTIFERLPGTFKNGGVPLNAFRFRTVGPAY